MKDVSTAHIVAASAAMRSVLDWVERVGPRNVTVLLLGESGVGKGLVAQALHDASHRRRVPLLQVNCGLVAESLLATELFGHRKGAFTGAVADKVGLVERAHRGTLFLDEVGEMSPDMQVGLLRFLEDGEIRRVGEMHGRSVDARVIAATNRPLKQDAGKGRFRQDLYYRLSVLTCTIPPLRDRPEDIAALVSRWLPAFAKRLESSVRGVTRGALDRLTAHSWPGNVRELQNVLEHAIVLSAGPFIRIEDVARAIDAIAIPDPEPDVPTERDRVLAALDENRWRLGETAATLGISRTTLWRRLKKLGLS